MAQRGRKSAATLAAMQAAKLAWKRPQPPEGLSERQAQEWRAVVAQMPADWFTRETHGLLIQYCRHVERAEAMERLVADAIASGDVEKMKEPLILAKRETEAIINTARQLRLSHQARAKTETATTAIKAAANEASGSKPWDVEEVA